MCRVVSFVTTSVLILLLTLPARGQAHRIENEYKLTVPRELTEAVWQHLETRYRDVEAFLAPYGGTFTVSFADEHFRDQYFDTPDLDMLRMHGGVRHRMRSIVGADESNRKHGRELIHIKLNRPDDLIVNRSEYKFPVRASRRIRDYGDAHPVMGLIKRGSRAAFRRQMAALGVSVNELRPSLLIEQRRRRVYLSRDHAPFATITLDEVSTSHWGKKVAFTEIELELNENAYTDADAAHRDAMQAVNDALKRDLMQAFPMLRQDQTPKYNKAFNALAQEFIYFPAAFRLGMPFELLGAGCGATMLGVGVVSWRRRRRGEHNGSPSLTALPHPGT